MKERDHFLSTNVNEHFYILKKKNKKRKFIIFFTNVYNYN